MDLNEKVRIELTLTAREWCRLFNMCDHISEEAHDDSSKEEPWYKEEWWETISWYIEKKLLDAGYKKEELWAYDEVEETNDKLA